MNLVAVGVSFRTAGVELRERVAFDDAGSMTTETMTSSDDTIGYVRTRSLDGARVVADTRELEQGDEHLTTELAFLFDGDDRITERRYTMNNVVVGRHTWTYAGDRVASHGIALFPSMCSTPEKHAPMTSGSSP